MIKTGLNHVCIKIFSFRYMPERSISFKDMSQIRFLSHRWQDKRNVNLQAHERYEGSFTSQSWSSAERVVGTIAYFPMYACLYCLARLSKVVNTYECCIISVHGSITFQVLKNNCTKISSGCDTELSDLYLKLYWTVRI